MCSILKHLEFIIIIIVLSSYLNKGISASEICNFASLVLALQRKMWRTTEYLSKTLTPQASSSSLCEDENMAVGAEKNNPFSMLQTSSPQIKETDARRSQTLR